MTANKFYPLGGLFMANFNLDKILNLRKWQELQDSIADVTDLAIITIDYKGKPISTHSNCRPFCQKVRSNPDLAKLCQRCDSRAGLEAVRSNKPYIYQCHYKIIDIAIPITNDDKYIGALMAGQVRLAPCKTIPDLEQISYSPLSLQALEESQQLKDFYGQIPILDYATILKVSDMLFKLCNYVVEEATDKNLILKRFNSPTLVDLNSLPNIEPEPASAPPSLHSSNAQLSPALKYVFNNPHLMVSLKKAAELCHLSPGYFSRTFSKEFNTNYTTYINKLKIKWAKELLTNTDVPVTQISDQLGFNDPGYFIKVFKKYEYLTPGLYRKYISSSDDTPLELENPKA